MGGSITVDQVTRRTTCKNPRCRGEIQKDDLAAGMVYCRRECSPYAILYSTGRQRKNLRPKLPPGMIGMRELCYAVGVSDASINNWANRGLIPFLSVNPKLRAFSLKEVKAAMKKQRLPKKRDGRKRKIGYRGPRGPYKTKE